LFDTPVMLGLTSEGIWHAREGLTALRWGDVGIVGTLQRSRFWAETALHSRNVRLGLWLLIVAQCVAVAAKLYPWLAGDSPSYLTLAGNLGRGFYGEILHGRIEPDALRPPAYPLILWFLTHVLKLGGGAVIALQLSAYLLSLHLIERFLARLAVPSNIFLLIAAIYPFGAVYSAGYMTESWVMLCYTALALLIARERMSLGAAALSGLLGGLLGLLRSDLLMAPVLGAAILVWRAARTPQPVGLRSFASAALLLVVVGLVLSPYAMWNRANFGKFSPAPMAAAAGNSLYSAYWQEHLSNETLTAFYSGRVTAPLVSSGYVGEIRRLNASFGAPKMTSPANPVNYPDNRTRIRTNLVFRDAAVEHFKQEPATYARHMVKNLWFLWNTSEFPGVNSAVKYALLLASAIVCIFGVAGGMLTLLSRLTIPLPRSLAAFLFYPFVLHIPLHLEARYTAAARPLLMMFAAVMVVSLLKPTNIISLNAALRRRRPMELS
jgi:hypothetical protein